MKFSTYTTQIEAEVLQQEQVSLVTGLTDGEHKKRLYLCGPNELTKKKNTAGKILLRQLRSPFIYLLFFASLLSLALGEILDAGFIFFFILLNTFLGFSQEYKSAHLLQTLEHFVVQKSRVRRNGRILTVPSRELVTGDVVLVETGDIIPADMRFLVTESVMIDESVVTGESVPTKKISIALPATVTDVYGADNIGFSGTTVLEGKGTGIVVATGNETMIGGIAHLTMSTVQESGFERGVNRLSKFILRLVLLTLTFVLVANIFLKRGSLHVIELIIFSIALAISVIPEALPVVTTFSLSSGAVRLAKKKVVVKRLSAIEDLGSIDVLCTDKTGTLTENILTVADILPLGEVSATDVASFASLTSVATEHGDTHNPFDVALHTYLGEGSRKKVARYSLVHEIPFDPVRRRHTVVVQDTHAALMVTKGALEEVLSVCKKMDTKQKRMLCMWAEKQGTLGRRFVVVAKKEIISSATCQLHTEEHELTCLGVVAFVDPLKKTTTEAIHLAKSLGVQIKIITGDSIEVAGAVAHEVGLVMKPQDVLSGMQLAAMTHTEQCAAVNTFHVFARISPIQKFHIIQLLQLTQEVGFLGEGINDAPALKIAHVGLVVADASDIARGAADVVLLNRSLHVIIDGIREGRQVFANTSKYIRATLSANFGNFYAIAFASLLIPYLPMLPIQILLVNLLSDFPMIAIATDAVDTFELRKPKHYRIKDFALIALLLGMVSSLFDFIFFGFFYHEAAAVLQTNWFIASVLTELAFLYSIRTRLWSWQARRPSWSLLILSVVSGVLVIFVPFTAIGQGLFQFVAPTLPQLALIFGIVAVYFLTTEIVKRLYYTHFAQAD